MEKINTLNNITKIDGVWALKEEVVIVEIPDRNGKKKLVVCENMDFAKKLFGSRAKRQATLYKDCVLNYRD